MEDDRVTMKTRLRYSISDDGEIAFNSAYNAAKKWIAGNINGPLRLRFAISLTAIPPGEEDAGEITSTVPMFPNGEPKKPRVHSASKSKACRNRHHTVCKTDGCGCLCHKAQGVEANG